MVMNNDMILVIDQGQIKEFDSPKNLLANEKSIFYNMVTNETHKKKK